MAWTAPSSWSLSLFLCQEEAEPGLWNSASQPPGNPLCVDHRLLPGAGPTVASLPACRDLRPQPCPAPPRPSACCPGLCLPGRLPRCSRQLCPRARAQRGGRAPPSPLLASGPGSAWCPLAAHSPSPERYGWACAGPAASEGQPRAGPGAGRVQGPGCGRPHVGTVVSAASQRLFGRGSWIDPRAPNR